MKDTFSQGNEKGIFLYYTPDEEEGARLVPQVVAACGGGLCRRVVTGRFLRLTGPLGRRVLKFDGPLARGVWYRPSGDEFYNSASRNGKPYNRASPDGNAPLFPCGDFPRRGKFALRSALGIISTSMHSTAKSSPSGGKVVPKVPKGVHFQHPQGGLLVFPRPPGRLYGFRYQRQHIYSSPPKAAIPQPSAAFSRCQT